MRITCYIRVYAHTTCMYTRIYMHIAHYIRVYTRTIYTYIRAYTCILRTIYASLYACITMCASMYVFNASDGVLAEGEYTHSASFVQRDCRIQKISCSFCVKFIRDDVNVVEASLVLTFYLSLRSD